MLYEPTNIIPSSMTQTGTVAATTDNVNIQWQVNGNSAMTMFQIDVMQNNADSTFVYSTGVVTENPTVAQGYSLPFYGKDRFGDYVQFVYQPNQKWAAWSGNAISDGNGYKFRITQFYQENGTAYKVPITSSLSAGTTYYFSYSVNGTTRYVSFTVANASYFVSGNTIYFNFSHNAGWVVTSDNNSRAITDITFSVSETQPSGTQLSGVVAVSSGDTFYNQFFTAQNSASSFITRTEPTLTITPLTETPVTSATQSFTATYSQEQGDNINTARWQLFNADDMSTPVDDTGDISTSVLSYEYNGLFDGQSYSVICTVTTESGVSVSATLDFSVQYEQGTYTGDFTAQSLCQEDANLLKWDTVSGIPGVANPEGSAVVSSGQLSLPANATVSWSQKSNSDNTLEPLNLQQPWTAVWNGDINQVVTKFLQDIKKTYLNYISDTTKSGTELNNAVSAIAFSPDGSLLVLGGLFTGYASLFSVSGNTVTYLSDITKSGTALSGYVYTAAFSPDGSTLVLGGSFIGRASIFSVSGTTVTYVADITKSGTALNSLVETAAFSPDGSTLVLGGGFRGNASIFSVSGTTVTYVADITKSGTALNGSVRTAAFSPDGSTLVLGGYFNSYASIFSVSGTTVTYVADITKSGTALNGVHTAAFSPDGSTLVLGGSFIGRASIFSVSGTTVTYVADITKSGTVLTNGVYTAAFSPDGSTLVLGGYFSGNASIFSVSGTTVTYVADITKSGTALSGDVQTAAFSPDGSTLVLGGGFSGYACLCSITYSKAIEENFLIASNNIYVSYNNNIVQVQYQSNGQILGKANVLGSANGGANQIVIALTPTALQVYSFLNNTYLGMQQANINYTQQNITSAQLQGQQTCNYFAIIGGNGTNITPYLTTPNFEPQWNNGGIYTVDLLASFSYGIDGGTATATGTGFRIYRRTADGTENIELATLPSTTLSLRDYGIKSNESYIYDFYVYDANGAFMGVRSTETTPLKRQFKRYSLLSTQYNESDSCYHVIKEYQFSCNIQDMSVSNNSNKSYVQNFTPYPTVFQSTANYASGTLQALIGFVDPKAYKYWDSTQLMDELNALSTTSNTLFLKDMKGHLWMVDVGTVQMTATQKTREMQVTISLPWTEIGAASDVSIIQTPDDEGWDYGEQVLDVKLDVDVNTGLLYVTYPFPYNGTAFYLVGTNPVGSENIVQSLPEIASSPQDGILKAKVRDK